MDQSTTFWNEDKIKEFLSLNSFAINSSLYFLLVAHRLKKGFITKNFSKKIPKINPDVLQTVIVFSNAIDLIEVSFNDQERIYTINKYNNVLSLMIKEVVYARAKKYDEDNFKVDEELSNESWVKLLQDIENYFNK